jgi:integrase
MAKALTTRTVETLRPRATRYEVGDGGCKNLKLTVMPSGHKSWSFLYRFDGFAERYTIGAFPEISLADAREATSEQRKLVKKGVNVQALRRAPPAPVVGDTVRRVVDEYLAKSVRLRNKPGTCREYARLLEADVVKPWGDRPIASITRRDVIAQLDVIIERGSLIGANRYLAVIKAMFNWAISRDIIAVSPAATIKRPTKEEGRDRVLSLDEMRAIYHAAGKLDLQYCAIVRLLLLTGARRGEIGGLRWSEINFKDRTIKLSAARTKTKKERDVYLSDAAFAIIEALPRIGDSQLVFPSSTGGEPNNFPAAKQALDRETGIVNMTLHDIRTGLTSALQSLGVGLQVTEKILGHSTGSIRGAGKTYHRFDFADDQRTALQRFASALLAPEVDKVVPLRPLTA